MSLLTLGGTDIHDRSGIFLDLVRGFNEPAALRGVDSVIPTLAGRIPRNRAPDTRTVTLEGYVTGSDAADWQANVAALMALLTTDESDLVIADGYLGTTGTLTLPVRCLSVPMGGSPMYAVMYQTWSIELTSVTPDWA